MKPDFPERREKLRGIMEKKKVDCILLTSPNDIFYYSGYRGLRDDRPIVLIPKDAEMKFLLSELSSEAQETYKNVVMIRRAKDMTPHLEEFKSIGYDERNTSSGLFTFLQKARVKWKPLSRSIKEPRMVKGSWEIEQIKKALKITKEVIEKIGPVIYGKTEKEVANMIETGFIKAGAQNAFEPIVASGPQSYFVHHKANDRRIGKKDMVILDLGCTANGYCSDVTRFRFNRRDRRQRIIYNDVKEMQADIIDSARDGARVDEIERLKKRFLRRKGYKFFHSFGHGIGLSTHEDIGKILRKNMVITVEPGVYIKNLGGCRIEDVVLVRKGKPLVISKSIRLQ